MNLYQYCLNNPINLIDPYGENWGIIGRIIIGVWDIYKSWKLRHEGKNDVFKYIEVFYNRKRRHETLGYVSPVVYEEMYELNQEQAA